MWKKKSVVYCYFGIIGKLQFRGKSVIRSSGGSVGVRRVVVFSLGGLGIPHEGSCHALSRFHRITAATVRGFSTGFEDGQGEGCPDRD